MSQSSATRVVIMLAAGAATIGLAMLLLPKPSTEVEPSPALVASPQAAPASTPLPVAAPPPPSGPVRAVAPPSEDPVIDADPRPPVSSRGVRQALLAQSDGVKACYEQWRPREADPEDRLSVTFFIEPGVEGSYVDRVELAESTLRSPQIEGCVLDLVESIEFQPTSTLTVYTFPFRFSERSRK